MKSTLYGAFIVEYTRGFVSADNLFILSSFDAVERNRILYFILYKNWFNRK